MEWFRDVYVKLLFLFMLQSLMLEACQRTNLQMHACLNTYLERDFSLIEKLVKRPPQDKNGHILVEEDDLGRMCDRLNDLKVCYEHMMFACVTYVEYSYMRRLLLTMKTIYSSLCNPSSYLIRNLILGGYCIEYARGESDCSKQSSLPANQQWPLTLVSLLRLNVTVPQMCTYLTDYNRCVFPLIERRCHKASTMLWNATLQTIDKFWC